MDIGLQASGDVLMRSRLGAAMTVACEARPSSRAMVREATLAVARRTAITVAALLLTGCSDSISVPGLPSVPVPDAVRVVKDVDQPKNVIERALSGCDRRIAAGEADCVRRALVAEQTSVPALVAAIPGCRAGKICRYDYTTIDRVGFVPATSTTFTVRWRVEFDLTKPIRTAGEVPITVAPL